MPSNFNYLGCLDNELPHPGSELAEEFQKNDKIIMEKEKTIIEVETHIYGKNQTLQSHICKKSPFYDDTKTVYWHNMPKIKHNNIPFL